MLEANDIKVNYGDMEAVKQASISVDHNKIVAIVGSNGAGKTTLIRAVSGLINITNGNIVFNDKRIDKLKPHDIVALGLIQIPEGRLLFPEMTVLENLEMGAYTARARKKAKATIGEVTELFPILRERTNQLAGTLSGGEQQMVAIGRGLMAQPRLLMLDEPSLGLAPLIVQEIFQIIETISQRGCSIMLVEQNAMHALSISDYAYVLENGTMAMQGPSEQLKDDERVREAYLGL